MNVVSALIAGLIFGVGITLSGMGNPAKVVNFFDIAGHWDPSLAFVMGGAVVVTFIGYRLVWRQTQPLFSAQFFVPQRSDIDRNLVAGSAIFGIGWGMAGFCPGGAIPALGFGYWEPVLFVASMIAGLSLVSVLRRQGGGSAVSA
ncbi:MAG: YeeE/YedE family protein [Stappiaceae bacterium]